MMCGRFSLSGTIEEVEAFVKSFDSTLFIPKDIAIPRYNIAPGQQVLALIHDGQRFRLGPLRWGFVPPYAANEKVGYQLINARSETIESKPAFKEAFEQQRCLLIADGFYEWNQKNGKKTPMRIVRKDRQIFVIAGIWSKFTRIDGSKLFSCSILTTAANELIHSIHDRMPIIIDTSRAEEWLNPVKKNKLNLHSLMKPLDSNLMDIYEVSPFVNNAINEDKRCIVPFQSHQLLQ